ncbi:MAG: hypothetical protein R3D32_11545 [Nitratireductor sp.]
MDENRNMYSEGAALLWRLRYWALALAAWLLVADALAVFFPAIGNALNVGTLFVWACFTFFGHAEFLQPNRDRVDDTLLMRGFIWRYAGTLILAGLLSLAGVVVLSIGAGINSEALIALLIMVALGIFTGAALALVGTWFPGHVMRDPSGLRGALRRGPGVFVYVIGHLLVSVMPLVVATLFFYMAPAIWGYTTRVVTGDGALHLLGAATNLAAIAISLLGNCIMVVILSRAYEMGEDRRNGMT